MAKGIVIYYSKTGNTKKMAEIIAKAMNDAELITECKSVEEVSSEDLLSYDAIVVGSPTYYGHAAGAIQNLFDSSVVKHGKLDGKIGASFASSANIAGGNETTIMGILESMLIHGMIIQGDPQGDHYGPVAIGQPDKRTQTQCIRRGERIAQLAKKLRF